MLIPGLAWVQNRISLTNSCRRRKRERFINKYRQNVKKRQIILSIEVYQYAGNVDFKGPASHQFSCNLHKFTA